MGRKSLGLFGALIIGCAAFAHPITASANTFVSCHDDSTLPIHTGHWTHGDPNTGLPGDDKGGNGYYYLAITAGCGAPAGSRVTLTGTIHLTSVVKGTIDPDGMCWRLDITKDYDHAKKLATTMAMGATVSLVFPNAIAGQHYRLRIANLESGVTVTDHGSFDG